MPEGFRKCNHQRNVLSTFYEVTYSHSLIIPAAPTCPQHTHPLSYTLVDLRISVTASFGAYMNKGKGCGEGGKQCPVLSI